MTLEISSVQRRLEELDTVLTELSRYEGITLEEIGSNLSLRWTVERGLLAAANLIFDIASHILAARFGIYPDSYEGLIAGLGERDVISARLCAELRGLGGFRNILVHEYVRIDPEEVFKAFRKGLRLFPLFGAEIARWIEDISSKGSR
jgi:uncharacterized protein YutE (UPF0331/DUF86 family)